MAKKKKKKTAAALKQHNKDAKIFRRLHSWEVAYIWNSCGDNLYVGPDPHANDDNGARVKRVHVSWWRGEIDAIYAQLSPTSAEIITPGKGNPQLKLFRRVVTDDYPKDPDYGRYAAPKMTLHFWERDIKKEIKLGLNPSLHPKPKLPGIDYYT